MTRHPDLGPEHLDDMHLVTLKRMRHEAAQAAAGATKARETACPFCGDDPQLTGPSWSFTIDHPITSLNRRVVNSGTAQHEYKRERTTWAWHLELAKRRLGIRDADTWRRLQIDRYHAGHHRALDYDNFVGGCKPLIDAMVKGKLLLSDDAGGVKVHYRQYRVLVAREQRPVKSDTYVRITLTELAMVPP